MTVVGSHIIFSLKPSRHYWWLGLCPLLIMDDDSGSWHKTLSKGGHRYWNDHMALVGARSSQNVKWDLCHWYTWFFALWRVFSPFLDLNKVFSSFRRSFGAFYEARKTWIPFLGNFGVVMATFPFGVVNLGRSSEDHNFPSFLGLILFAVVGDSRPMILKCPTNRLVVEIGFCHFGPTILVVVVTILGVAVWFFTANDFDVAISVVPVNMLVSATMSMTILDKRDGSSWLIWTRL